MGADAGGKPLEAATAEPETSSATSTYVSWTPSPATFVAHAAGLAPQLPSCLFAPLGLPQALPHFAIHQQWVFKSSHLLILLKLTASSTLLLIHTLATTAHSCQAGKDCP